MHTEAIVIVGGGQAAAQLVTSLRRGGCERRIVMLCEELHVPYQRPPLSKGYLSGRVAHTQLPIRQEAYYRDKQIELHLGCRATTVDRSARCVRTEDGGVYPYGKLVLACGARVRRLQVPGDELTGVHYLRTLEDADHLRSALQPGVRVVVVGGGFLGLEFAASIHAWMQPPVLIESAPRLLPRIGAAELSEFYRHRHESHGVAVHTGLQIIEFGGREGRVCEVRCAGGKVFPADLVLVSVGVVPNMELAAAAGLAVADGVVVDAHARTSDPDIFCAGDLAAHVNVWAQDTDAPLRLESVQHATDQARTVAAALLEEDAPPYTAVPWFWSDQYDLKLQMAGLCSGFDRVVMRGGFDTGQGFALCYFRGPRFIAMDSINRPADHAAARKLLAAGVSPTSEQAADADLKLRSLL